MPLSWHNKQTFILSTKQAHANTNFLQSYSLHDSTWNQIPSLLFQRWTLFQQPTCTSACNNKVIYENIYDKVFCKVQFELNTFFLFQEAKVWIPDKENVWRGGSLTKNYSVGDKKITVLLETLDGEESVSFLIIKKFLSKS